MLDLFIGKRELGKTTLAVSVSRFYETRVIFDPRHMIHTTSDVLTGNVKGVLYEMLNERSEVIVRPSFNVQETFADTCAEIYEWLRRNPFETFCFTVDEIRFVEQPELNPHFDYIIRCTPREFVATLATMHGIVDVSTDLRRVADYLILFRLTLEADVERVREQCGNEVADKVQTLEPYQYIVWNDANGTWRLHTNSAKWFVPLDERKVSA